MTNVSISLGAQEKMPLTSPLSRYNMPSVRRFFSLTTLKENTMKNLRHVISNLLSDESGQDLIEYALVAALIALGATAAMSTLATTISTAFGTVGSKLTSNV
jgi:pilus assembly protein Flp/PilA